MKERKFSFLKTLFSWGPVLMRWSTKPSSNFRSDNKIPPRDRGLLATANSNTFRVGLYFRPGGDSDLENACNTCDVPNHENQYAP